MSLDAVRPARRDPAGPPSGLPAAVLWDMDGLLVDSEPLWTLAEQELAASWGKVFEPRVKAAMIGRRLDESVPILLAALGVREDPDRVAARLLARMVELFATAPAVRPGARALLAALDAAGVPQALVSSSYRVLLDALPADLLGHFATSVAGDEVARAKPDPQAYLAAAAALGVPARGCVVLEDSEAGASAGAAGGAAVVLVPSVVTVRPRPGWAVASSLAELTPTALGALLGAPGAVGALPLH